MRAIRLHEFGPPENLRVEELPDLRPTDGEVRMSVAASGVHLVDTSIRRGEEGPFPRPDLPTVPGREVVGTVDLVGDGVDPAWLGTRVVAHLGMVPGGYADQAVTAVDNLIRLPDDLGFRDAVALVGTGRTAEAVLEHVRLAPDDVVLVPAAAGGLGWLLVQGAKEAGATVIAAARGEAKTALLEDSVADLVVDYGDPDWAAQVGRKVTVVLDGVGGTVGRAALELLVPGGRLLMFGYSSGSVTEVTTQDLVGRSITAGWGLGPQLFSRPGGIKGLAERALARAARGGWRPLVTAYPLGEAARAHRDLEERRTVGKVVLYSATDE